jgi:exoribonuclease-2
VSFYAEVSPQLEIVATESRIEAVRIADNLRHDTLDVVFNAAAVALGRVEHPFGAELLALHRLAETLEAARTKGAPVREARTEYSFHVLGEHVEITERKRGSPIDRVVAELMILVNSRWAELLDQHEWSAIFRAQRDGKVRLSTAGAPHQGLGVERYIWASSPLRRYVDLINQRQLVALIRNQPPPYARNSEPLFAAMRAFELTYDIYADFQRQMERYWCLRWILQENATRLSARVLRENLVRLERLPLVLRVSSLPDLAGGSRVELTVGAVDLYELSLECDFRERLAA